MAVQCGEILPRSALGLVVESLADFRVTVLNGARQAGKTTLVRQVHATRGGSLVTLDDEDVRRAAIDDPAGFVTAFPSPLIIDEVQRGGDPLVLAVKAAVDRDPIPGRFLLTGSTRFLTVPSLSESLAGRARIIDLWPFSQGELIGVRERFLDRLLGEPEVLRAGTPPADRSDVLDRLCRGGFPEVQRMSTARSRRAWFDGYVQTVTSRDVAAVAKVRQLDELPRLLRLVAAGTSQELNAASLSRRLGLDEATVRSYLRLLETVFLVYRLPAWSRNLSAKIGRRPKLFLTDTGLAAQLLGVDPAGLAVPTAPARGPLFETFVLGEVARQQTWTETPVRLYHLRDRDGPEVDLVVEAADGRVVGIESKAAQSVRTEDFRGLAWLRDRLGPAFVHGVVLHAGPRALPFGDRLSALPVTALWSG
jgi:predicted AAA+ superfamily ATPase